jgi:hypothetical protein
MVDADRCIEQVVGGQEPRDVVEQRSRLTEAKKYEVKAGRQIYHQGKPFISINKEGDTRPVEADTITHTIAMLLNKYHK